MQNNQKVASYEWFLIVLRRYFQFQGRATRSEFWNFQLYSALIYVLLSGVAILTKPFAVLGFVFSFDVLGLVFFFLILFPSLGVISRRLHDTGHSFWWYLILVVPLIGSILLLVWFCQDSQPTDNRFGPNPKGSF